MKNTSNHHFVGTSASIKVMEHTKNHEKMVIQRTYLRILWYKAKTILKTPVYLCVVDSSPHRFLDSRLKYHPLSMPITESNNEL